MGPRTPPAHTLLLAGSSSGPRPQGHPQPGKGQERGQGAGPGCPSLSTGCWGAPPHLGPWALGQASAGTLVTSLPASPGGQSGQAPPNLPPSKPNHTLTRGPQAGVGPGGA